VLKNIISLLLLASALTSCGSVPIEPDYPKSQDQIMEERVGKLTGEGIVLFGGKNSSKATEGINVNSYLWRAALDSVYFMPLISADPFGGTIVTDWYNQHPDSNERYKLNIIIVGAELRPDAIKVAAFKQIKNRGGAWQDTTISSELASDIEDRIILKAREFKFASTK
jgi:hypothetical protein